jgi:hypothetical protein
MRFELQVIPDCPHATPAYNLLRRALDDIGLSRATITTTVIADDEHARRVGFHGSPSFAVNGRDILTPPDPTPAWSCRLYRTSTGTAPLPELIELRQHLKEAAAADQP